MLDVFIRAALFLLQNQVTNTSGTSSNRVRCDQTVGKVLLSYCQLYNAHYLA